MNSTISVNNASTIATCIILFTAFLFLFNTGKRDLWAPDEPRYAQVSKEMRDSGNFIVPHLNSAPYPDKPPLLFWLVNLFSIPFGKITALSSRLLQPLQASGVVWQYFILVKVSIKTRGSVCSLRSSLPPVQSSFGWLIAWPLMSFSRFL